MIRIFKHSGNFENYPEIMNIGDVQEVLGIGRSMAYRLIKEGKLKCIRIGKAIRVPKKFLIDFIENLCYNETVVNNSAVTT